MTKEILETQFHAIYCCLLFKHMELTKGLSVENHMLFIKNIVLLEKVWESSPWVTALRIVKGHSIPNPRQIRKSFMERELEEHSMAFKLNWHSKMEQSTFICVLKSWHKFYWTHSKKYKWLKDTCLEVTKHRECVINCKMINDRLISEDAPPPIFF